MMKKIKKLKNLRQQLKEAEADVQSGKELAAISLRFGDIKTANRMSKASSDSAAKAARLRREIQKLEEDE